MCICEIPPVGQNRTGEQLRSVTDLKVPLTVYTDLYTHKWKGQSVKFISITTEN